MDISTSSPAPGGSHRPRENEYDNDESTAGDSRRERVELAALILPSSALQSGLAPRVGNHVVLEASNETVDGVLAASHHSSTAPPPPPIPQSDADNQTACIQAVVDLEELSRLAKLPKDEFVNCLNQEVPREQSLESTESIAPDIEEAGETTPLLPPRRPPIPIRQHLYQHRPPVPPRHPPDRHRRVHSEMERVALCADPFVEVLMDSLPPRTAAAKPSAKKGHRRRHTVASVTPDKEEGRYLAHDAFLLQVLTTARLGGGGSAAPDERFVLALPQIEVSPEDTKEPDKEDGEGSFVPLVERVLSILPDRPLPTDVESIHLEATTVTVPVPAELGRKEGEEEEGRASAAAAEICLDLVVKRKVPPIGYVLLVAGMFALSSAGTALALQGTAATPSMKAYWRQTATATFLFPFALRSVLRDGLPKLSTRQLASLPLCALMYAVMTVSFVYAVSLTTISNAALFGNVTPIVVLLFKALLGQAIMFLEGSGAAIGVLGGIICAGDESSSSSEGELASLAAASEQHPHALLGDMLALLCSFAYGAYLIIAKQLRSSVDLFLFMFCVMSLASCFVVAFMLASGEPVSLFNHPKHGLLGWTYPRPDRLPLELYMVLVVNFMGTIGYVGIMKYFDAIVVSTMMLMEPVAAAFIGATLGLDGLPGMQTWIGDAVVIVGTFLVVLSGSRRTESIDGAKSIRPRLHDGANSANKNGMAGVEMGNNTVIRTADDKQSSIENPPMAPVAGSVKGVVWSG